MPRLISCRPGALATGVDLSAGLWRLLFGATMWGDTVCLALIYQPEPPPPAVRVDGVWSWPTTDAIQAMQVALVRIAMPFAVGAEGYGGMQRVAHATNEEGSLENALKRVREALTLFRNSPKVREEDVNAGADRAEALVKIGWEIREWITLAGTTGPRREWTVDGSLLVGTP